MTHFHAERAQRRAQQQGQGREGREDVTGGATHRQHFTAK
jgi:hypothetical protein